MVEISERVEQALDSVRPYLIKDGGNVKLLEITDDMMVKVELLGACSSCSMSEMTMRAGIEEAVKKEIPEIMGVIAVN